MRESIDRCRSRRSAVAGPASGIRPSRPSWRCTAASRSGSKTVRRPLIVRLAGTGPRKISKIRRDASFQHHDVVVAVHHERGIGLLLPQRELERAANVFELRRTERPLQRSARNPRRRASRCDRRAARPCRPIAAPSRGSAATVRSLENSSAAPRSRLPSRARAASIASSFAIGEAGHRRSDSQAGRRVLICLWDFIAKYAVPITSDVIGTNV